MEDKLTKKELRERNARFANDPVKPDEVGTVTGANGKQVAPGEDGFMEAMALEYGFVYEEEV